LKTKQLTFGQVFRSLFKRKAHAIWSWSDPKPYFTFLRLLTGKYMRRSAR